MIGMLPQQAKHEQNSKVSLLASETCVRLQAFGRNRGNIAMQSMMPRASPAKGSGRSDQAGSDSLDVWMAGWNGTLELYMYVRTYRSSDVGHFYLTMTGAQMLRCVGANRHSSSRHAMRAVIVSRQRLNSRVDTKYILLAS